MSHVQSYVPARFVHGFRESDAPTRFPMSYFAATRILFKRHASHNANTFITSSKIIDEIVHLL